MSRKRLIEYLNDPSLLHSISIEELKDWAKQVPYAGLIQKLLVQKLILTKAPEEDLKEATTLAILSNARPGLMLKSIDDFKKMMLTTSLDEMVDNHLESGESVQAHGVSDNENVTSDEKIDFQKQDEVSIEEDKSDLQEDHKNEMSAQYSELPGTVEMAEDEGEEFSSFTSWVMSLKPIKEVSDDKREDIQLKDKELASSALAELLVKQGHYKRAIAMYELLMLKNPQKSSFFAAQIEKLKSL